MIILTDRDDSGAWDDPRVDLGRFTCHQNGRVHGAIERVNKRRGDAVDQPGGKKGLQRWHGSKVVKTCGSKPKNRGKTLNFNEFYGRVA